MSQFCYSAVHRRAEHMQHADMLSRLHEPREGATTAGESADDRWNAMNDDGTGGRSAPSGRRSADRSAMDTASRPPTPALAGSAGTAPLTVRDDAVGISGQLPEALMSARRPVVSPPDEIGARDPQFFFSPNLLNGLICKARTRAKQSLLQGRRHIFLPVGARF